jgi:hypothetical protein
LLRQQKRINKSQQRKKETKSIQIKHKQRKDKRMQKRKKTSKKVKESARMKMGESASQVEKVSNVRITTLQIEPETKIEGLG